VSSNFDCHVERFVEFESRTITNEFYFHFPLKPAATEKEEDGDYGKETIINE
jgi:hypothetical protein